MRRDKKKKGFSSREREKKHDGLQYCSVVQYSKGKRAVKHVESRGRDLPIMNFSFSFLCLVLFSSALVMRSSSFPGQIPGNLVFEKEEKKKSRP